LWLNEYWAFQPNLWGKLVVAWSILMSVLAVVGLGVLCRQFRGLARASNETDIDRRRTCLLILNLVALALLPVAVLLYDRQSPCQVQSVLLTVSPLLVVGTAHAWDGLGHAKLRKLLGWSSLTALLAMAAAGTASLALATTKPMKLRASFQEVVLDSN